MDAQLEAVLRDNDDYVLLKVDAHNFKSPVVEQFDLRRVPYVELYDGRGELKHKGFDAMVHLKRLKVKALEEKGNSSDSGPNRVPKS